STLAIGYRRDRVTLAFRLRSRRPSKAIIGHRSSANGTVLSIKQRSWRIAQFLCRDAANSMKAILPSLQTKGFLFLKPSQVSWSSDGSSANGIARRLHMFLAVD